jgi:hypothetical protein
MARGPRRRQERLVDGRWSTPLSCTAHRRRLADSLSLALALSANSSFQALCTYHSYLLLLCFARSFPLVHSFSSHCLFLALSFSRPSHPSIYTTIPAHPFTRDTHDTNTLGTAHGALPIPLLVLCSSCFLPAPSDLPRDGPAERPSPTAQFPRQRRLPPAGMSRAVPRLLLDRHVARIAALTLTHASPSPRTL